MDDFSILEDELLKILEALPNNSAEELEIIFPRLEELGVELPEVPKRKPGIQCPVTEMTLVAPCNISNCSYRIQNEWHRNCLLDYLDVRGSGELLAIEEIAFLHNDTPQAVKRTIEKGMAELKSNSLNTMGFTGDYKKAKSPEIKANLNEDDLFKVGEFTLSPTFMEKTNLALEKIVSSKTVHKHPAIRLLGILDSIINEL